MIAIEAGEGVSALYRCFLEALKARSFDGEIGFQNRRCFIRCKPH